MSREFRILRFNNVKELEQHLIEVDDRQQKPRGTEQTNPGSHHNPRGTKRSGSDVDIDDDSDEELNSDRSDDDRESDTVEECEDLDERFDNRECFYCHKVGHIIAECGLRKRFLERKSRGEANTSGTSSDQRPLSSSSFTSSSRNSD